MEVDIQITRNPRGYYTLTIDGKFEGNYDSAEEASREVSSILDERYKRMKLYF